MGEDARADWVESDCGRGGIVDDFDRKHDEELALTIFIVKKILAGVAVHAAVGGLHQRYERQASSRTSANFVHRTEFTPQAG